MKLTSQMRSATSRMPTVWPAKTVLRLILRRPMQMLSCARIRFGVALEIVNTAAVFICESFTFPIDDFVKAETDL